MGTTDWSQVRTWESSEAASVHGASSAQALSIDKKLVPKFATKTARNAAADGTAANNTGRVCYVEEISGYTYHDGVAWLPLGARTLYSTSGAGVVSTSSATPATSINTGSITLPAGSRLLLLIGRGYMTTDGGDGTWLSGRAFLQQSSAPIAGMMHQCRVSGSSTSPGALTKESFNITDTVVTSGSQSFQLCVLREGGSGATWCYLESGSLRVIDLGPASAV